MNEETTDAWVEDVLVPTLENYKPQDVFNVDETGLFWKFLPDKTFTFRGECCRGGKKSKERITVMICRNMDGSEKLQPLVIGKYASPRCFKHAKKLPVEYFANSSAWMTREIFQQWLLSFDKKMQEQNRHVLLVMDNCSVHKVQDMHLAAVKILFLPANATPKLQPCDVGIIRNVKVQYRTEMVRNLLANVDGGGKARDYKMSLFDAVHFLKRSWDKVTPGTIINSFNHAGFRHGPSDECTFTDCEEPEPIPAQLFEEWNISPSEYYTVDDNVVTNGPPACPVFPAGPSSSTVPDTKAGDTGTADEDGDSDTQLEKETRPISAREVLAAADTINTFCM